MQIDILLATYNGAAFLPEQLGSLLSQTHTDWRLLVRDDGSTDGSLQIVKDWARDNDVDCRVVDEGTSNIGASASFGKLLEASSAPYFAFCDQDDVWLPTKLEKTLNAIQDAEDTTIGPVLAYCDLVVVDRNLTEIAPSFREFCSIGTIPTERAIRKLVVQNTVTGCATMGNAALRETAIPVATEARMHDWWLALVACQFGTIIEINDALILYRQHGNNTLGAKRLDFAGKIRRILASPIKIWSVQSANRRAQMDQARAFHNRFADRLDDHAKQVLAGYANLESMSLIARRRFILQHRFRPQTPLSRLAERLLT
ncbi:glycosyltransferase family 2 protein [Croceicoccus naphthovorans]|uniref:glycosyltransferase family 2 protein n=1 Tax=Croceicoccus naphthovorans TaxID=1348774 RepID=UPI0014706524|nr:glycosyltransferase family 2 protein [Croceicoccus naphthovorans]MBB3990613.1 glycosyltransferase involved in cell wall biosynthesis [Croceicoccus naphthovorans]